MGENGTRYLGFCTNGKNISINFNEIIKRVIYALEKIRKLNLPMITTIMLINTYALSKLWYYTYIEQLNNNDILFIEKTIRKTLWKNKAIFSLKHLQMPFTEGGLNLTNIRVKLIAQKIMWGIKIMNGTQNFGKIAQNFILKSFNPLPPWFQESKFKSTKSDFINDIFKTVGKFIKMKSHIKQPNGILFKRNEKDIFLSCQNVIFKYYKSINRFKLVKSKILKNRIQTLIERANHIKSESLIQVQLEHSINLSTKSNLPNVFFLTSKNGYNEWRWFKEVSFNNIYHTVFAILIHDKIKLRKHVLELNTLKEEVLFIKKLKIKPSIKDFLYKRIFNANPWSCEKFKICVFCFEFVELEHITRLQCHIIQDAFKKNFNDILQNTIKKMIFAWSIWKTFNYIYHNNLTWNINIKSIIVLIQKFFYQDLPVITDRKSTKKMMMN
jgi:hypothetical protein